MSKSLFYQFNCAIDSNYHHFFNKHGDKHNPESDSGHIVKSLCAKSNLKDFAHDFSRNTEGRFYRVTNSCEAHLTYYLLL